MRAFRTWRSALTARDREACDSSLQGPAPGDDSRPPIPGSREDSFALANQYALNSLSQQIGQQPTMNIVPLLGHILNTYESQRQCFEQVVDDGGGPGQSTGVLPVTDQNDVRAQFQATTEVRIIVPLAESLRSLLCHAEEGSTLPQRSVLKLNELLRDSSIIWELGRLVVLKIRPKIVVKIAADIDTGHISDVKYLRSKSSNIPIPDVLGVLKTDSLTYLFMSEIDGQPLDKLWPALSDIQKESIRDQLDLIFSNIRALTPPPDEIGMLELGGGSPRRCKDMRRDLYTAKHVITSESQFNGFLLSSRSATDSSQHDMILSFLRTDHAIVFTHGDLHPRNIMIEQEENSVHISGIIDWELCGWYPSYWEYVKALHTVSERDGTADWWKYLPLSIGSWGSEYAIDLMISRWIG